MTGVLPVVNLEQARFDCTYGRGCEGICCREGRPLLYKEEIERLDDGLARIVPHLRPEARERVRARGYATRRRRLGERMARVAGGWCVFFNAGCVLHRLGEEEGDPFRYKPAVCALFPIQRDDAGGWYVRQKGYKGEKWELPCLDPALSSKRASETLLAEIALAKRLTVEEKRSSSPRPSGARSRSSPDPADARASR